MEKHAAVVMLTTYAVASLITTAAGLLVAVPAAWSYNYLRVRVDLLEGEIPRITQRKSRYFPVAQKFPLRTRFSKLPFAVIAAPGLAIIVLVWIPFFLPGEPSGVSIELASTRCEFGGDDHLIVLHITDSGEVFLNQEQEEWNSLAGRLSEIYSTREHRKLYLRADNGVPFQTVADALNIVGNIPATMGPRAGGTEMDRLYITVLLLTPRAEYELNAGCLLEPVAIGSSDHVSR